MLRFPEEVRESRNVILAWEARDFRNDTPPDQLLYRSRVDGEPWTRFSHARFRELSDLAPGAHVFEVEVRDLDGNRNREEVIHRFTVRQRGPGPTAWIVAGIAGGLALALIAFLALRRILAVASRLRTYRDLFRSPPMPLLVLDGAGNLRAVSGIAPETLGVDPEGLAQSIGRPVHLLPLFMTKELRAAVRDLLMGEPFLLRGLRWAPDGGRDRILEVRGFPLGRTREGAPTGAREGLPEGSSEGSPEGSPEGLSDDDRPRSIRSAAIFVEDTTRRSEEERLQEKTRRLDSLRDLSDRIVGRALGLFQDPGLREIARSEPRLRPRIQDGESVLSTLAEFAGSETDSSVWSQVSVNQILESLVGDPDGDPTIRARLAPAVRLDYRGQHGVWNVRGDPRRLRTALVEVIENAVESMPAKGTLTIRTANARLEYDPGHLAPGAYVEVEVRDTGAGMDAGQLEHVLEPFYSTKPRDRASGAGLSTAYGIVRAHGGDIRIESRPGQGTTVRILLPARRGG
jgi:signal transduction histidine kinase